VNPDLRNLVTLLAELAVDDYLRGDKESRDEEADDKKAGRQDVAGNVDGRRKGRATGEDATPNPA
jgi:hypothetical protein